MRNLKVTIAYRGTGYHGFQRQINSVGVQNVLEEVLSKIADEKIELDGCSRTDTGVHANEFCFSFRTEKNIPCRNFIRALNTLLPKDISVSECVEMPPDFHARYSCTAKEYCYLILNSPYRNAFMSDLALHYPRSLDDELLKKAARDYVGTHDFTSFCGTANLKENCVRTVEYFEIEKNESLVKLIVKGDGFLYNMVRIMVGTLLEINEGKLSPDAIPQILAAKDRNAAGRTAPPHGLYLNKVFYDIN